MSKRRAKKSENIDVRISYEAKRALYRRAEIESRTVSELVRELIGMYILNPDVFVVRSERDDNNKLLKNLTRKPKTVIAGILTALAASLVFIPAANADDYLLDIKGEIVHTDLKDAASISTKRIETTILLSEGDSFEYDLGTGNMVVQPEDMIIRVKVNETGLGYDKKGVLITMSIIEKQDGVEVIVVEPALTVELGKTAEFSWGSEPGKMYSFKFIPSEKS